MRVRNFAAQLFVFLRNFRQHLLERRAARDRRTGPAGKLHRRRRIRDAPAAMSKMRASRTCRPASRNATSEPCSSPSSSYSAEQRIDGFFAKWKKRQDQYRRNFFGAATDHVDQEIERFRRPSAGTGRPAEDRAGRGDRLRVRARTRECRADRRRSRILPEEHAIDAHARRAPPRAATLRRCDKATLL